MIIAFLFYRTVGLRNSGWLCGMASVERMAADVWSVAVRVM
jgi:hypothetical protein